MKDIGQSNKDAELAKCAFLRKLGEEFGRGGARQTKPLPTPSPEEAVFLAFLRRLGEELDQSEAALRKAARGMSLMGKNSRKTKPEQPF